MGLYISIAQVAPKASSRKLFYVYMYMSLMKDIMLLTYLYDNMHSMSPMVSI